MTQTPAAPEPIVENPGFTLIEDDDVAFSVSLCREIHRIYSTYQSGQLDDTDAVHAGLNLTMQMFAVLQNSVTDGMPALRLEVGAAQAREMMAALFGEGLPYRRSREVIAARKPVCGRRPSPALAGAIRQAVPAGETAATEAPARKELVEQHPTDLSVAAPAELSLPGPAAVGPTPSPAQPSRSRRILRSAFKVVVALLALCLAAVLIDVPFAILALYPNHFVPICIGFGVFAIVAGLANRMVRSRRALSV
jgi:hypothetical protein